MPDYVPIQDLVISADLQDDDYVPVSDGSTTFAVRAEKFKTYSTEAAEEAARTAVAAAENVGITYDLKLDGVQRSINRFTKAGASAGSAINPSTGEIYSASNSAVSDYLFVYKAGYVTPFAYNVVRNEITTTNTPSRYIFYDLAKNVISYGSFTALTAKEVPSSAWYVRVQYSTKSDYTYYEPVLNAGNDTNYYPYYSSVIPLDSLLGKCQYYDILDFSSYIYYRSNRLTVNSATTKTLSITNSTGSARYFGVKLQHIAAGKCYKIKLTMSNISAVYLSLNSSLDTGAAWRHPVASTIESSFYAVADDMYLSFGINDSVTATITGEVLDMEADGMQWVGKSWLCYGDSITAISNGNGLGIGWAQYVNSKDLFGMFYGRGVGGQSYVWNTDTCQVDADGNYVNAGTSSDNCKGCFSSWDRISKMIPNANKNDIHLIVLMGGTNDLANGNVDWEPPVWSSTNTTDTDWTSAAEYNGGDYDVTTFSGAIASTVMKMQARCPNAIVVIASPLSRWNIETKRPYENNGKTIYNMADIEKQVSQFMCVPFLDVTNDCGINAFNYTTFITDGLHPYNDEGHRMLARTILGGLQRLYPRQLG